MIKNPPPLKGLDIRIPITIPIKGRGFINHGSGLGCHASALGFWVWGAGYIIIVVKYPYGDVRCPGFGER